VQPDDPELGGGHEAGGDRDGADVVGRHRLLDNAELACAELGFSSDVIVAVKRRP
jgi:hypothetical protein